MANFIIVHSVRVAPNFEPETFGRLTTVGPKFRIRDRSFQVCACSCGSVIVAEASGIRNGHKRSCWCLHRDSTVARSTTHGKHHSSEYNIWTGIQQRCYNNKEKGFPRYGGRGIRVCARWLEPVSGFSNFLADMGERPSKGHSIDRMDNDGNYCPENCRWATRKEQSRNQRTNALLTYQGKTQCLSAWAEELNINCNMLRSRISRGWSVVAALTTPNQKTQA